MKVMATFSATMEVEIDDEFIAIVGDNIFNLPESQADKMINDCLSACDEKVREAYPIPGLEVFCVETVDTRELIVEL